jgi:hypothetical protein
MHSYSAPDLRLNCLLKVGFAHVRVPLLLAVLMRLCVIPQLPLPE